MHFTNNVLQRNVLFKNTMHTVISDTACISDVSELLYLRRSAAFDAVEFCHFMAAVQDTLCRIFVSFASCMGVYCEISVFYFKPVLNFLLTITTAS